jgi:PST family polysaccharide transporter
MSEESNSSSSYKQILKSSFLVGGAQVITILVGIIKNKILAVLIGPQGMGILGIYTTLGTLICSVFNFGLGSSGVKQISENSSSTDITKRLFITKRIRQLLALSGVVTVLLMVTFSNFLGRISFGSDFKQAYAIGIAVLSGFVFFENLSVGERAILQGRRQLKDLAKTQVLGSVIGAVLSIVSIYFLRENGVALFLVATSLCTYLLLRKYNGENESGSLNRLSSDLQKEETRKLLSLGMVFVTTTLAGAVVAYIIRIIIVDLQGITGAGIYQAALSLTNMSFNVVLMAMGTDFYPRLVTVSQNNEMVKKEVNEQVDIALLVSLPILLALFIFAPLIVQIIYSSSFNSSIELIRWLAVSCFLRVLCWPLGYIFIAKGANRLYVVSSIVWEVLHVPLIFFFAKQAGLAGIGISYIVDYSLVVIGSSLLAYRYYKFRWSKEVMRSFLISLVLIGFALLLLNIGFSSQIYYYLLASPVLLYSMYRSFRLIKSRMGLDLSKLFKRKRS